MQVNVQKLSPVLVEFDVVIDADLVKKEVDKAYRSVAKTARVRGFRPGKAPRKVLTHMFGARVAADVAQRLVDDSFPKAVSEQKVQPISSPAFEPQKLVDNQPFTYKARFEIIPEIDSVDYEGLEAQRPKTTVEPEDLEVELSALRRENSTLEATEGERGAQKGDVVTIDFDVEVNGQLVEGAGAQDFQVELGAGSLIPAIEEALIGLKVGAQANAKAQMPEAHPHPALRAQEATFKLTLKELKVRVLPELDDEFAKDLGDYATLDDLKKGLSEQIESRKKEQAENTLAERLVVALVQKNPIPLPPSLVQRQMKVTEQEILQRARAQGQTVTGLGAELRQKVQADSEVKVRAGLLMAEIAKKEKLQIGNEQIEEGIKELAEQTGKNVAKVRAEYSDPKRREMLIGMILENKVLDIIEAKAKITDE
jgi:trigger factor